MAAEEMSDATLQEWKKKEQELETVQLRSQLEKLQGPAKKTCLHRTFDFHSFIMCMAGLLMIIGQIVGLYFYEMDSIQIVVRCYVTLLSVIVVLNELQWFKFIRESAILHNWMSRGILYSFVGVLGLDEMNSERETSNVTMGHDQAIMFIKVVAYMMVACGILYFLMGVLCFQLIYNRVVQDYETRSTEAAHNQRRVREDVV